MARGAKKSLEEKIRQKEELIDSLSTRLKKEHEELNELLEAQKMEELNELRLAVQRSGLEISDIDDKFLKSGLSPPCMQSIFSSINAATGK